ncbi:SMC hinge domain-containing protein [Trichostrongylus colubriformis]|uniref:SMC hinge domain-containing protein n=1 Tax=Trichostrongylus colubriformis TaxID=6319 RepID=A0AAN8FKG3_TRICO
MGVLHTLDLENFKSYRGKQVVGPFKRFTAIIGPNGSGKSNLMDAISFVLGEKATSLRVKKLGVVSVQQYNHEMESIQIFIKAKNFLVYQGQIESIAMKNPKERTALFEEISRSCELQAEYDRLKVELQKAEEDAQQNMYTENTYLYDVHMLFHQCEPLQIDYLAENTEQQKVVLQNEKLNLVSMEKQVKESKEKLEKVSVELNEINKQLSDASGDSAESERVRRRNEAIENLKRVFPDKIHGRLVDLCQPSHKRFNLAVTKVLQKHMMSIVCDSEETARDAIMYLKEQRYPPETFLPHHGLDVHPINEKLRELTHPKGVKLVFDVIQCNHPAARKALQFACGNALICETADDARTLAYGSAGGDRYKAVSLDGTMFQQSGVIGGGSHELKMRAKKWDENALKQLRERRAQLQEESNTLHRTRRKELDVEMQRNKLTSVEYRLKNMQLEKTKCETDTLNKLTIELEALESELSVIPPKIEEIEERMQEREREIAKIEEKSNAVADDVFANFCKKVGIKNIREYEEREMRFHQEKVDRMREFDNELDRIRNELEYLRSEDKNRKVKQEMDKVKNLEKELEALKKKETKEGKVLARLEKEMEDLKLAAMEKKNEQEALDAELATVKKEAQVSYTLQCCVPFR